MSKFKLSEMTCDHCDKAITAELTKGDSSVIVKVDLKSKIIQVENLPDDRVFFLLKEIGYSPELMK